jgi:integrase/recombinase XerD
MLDVCYTVRARAIVELISTTGMRRGAIPTLKKRDLVPVEKCYMIKVYADEAEEYVTFCTPEARVTIENYFEWRRVNGEDITDESPVIDIKARHKTSPDKIFELSIRDIKEKAKLEIESTGEGAKKRYAISTAHGFRKFFNTQLNKAGVPHNTIEKLMGHKNGLKGLYYTPESSDLFEEYKKAIPNLTLLDNIKQKQVIEELKEKSVKDELVISQEVLDLRQQVEMLQRQLIIQENDPSI